MTRTTLTLTAVAAALAATLAFAAPGGYGPGPGYGQGCAQGQACGAGPGYGPGAGYGPGHGRGGAGSMMTDEERAAHREKMHSFTSVGECKAYFEQHRAEMAARAKAQGVEPGPGPRGDPCERMARRGLLKPAS
jgi:hypothetical protein